MGVPGADDIAAAFIVILICVVFEGEFPLAAAPDGIRAHKAGQRTCLRHIQPIAGVTPGVHLGILQRGIGGGAQIQVRRLAFDGKAAVQGQGAAAHGNPIPAR